jgi:hypothetical protein
VDVPPYHSKVTLVLHYHLSVCNIECADLIYLQGSIPKWVNKAIMLAGAEGLLAMEKAVSVPAVNL